MNADPVGSVRHHLHLGHLPLPGGREIVAVARLDIGIGGEHAAFRVVRAPGREADDVGRNERELASFHRAEEGAARHLLPPGVRAVVRHDEVLVVDPDQPEPQPLTAYRPTPTPDRCDRAFNT